MAGICIVFPVEFDGSLPDTHLTSIFLGPVEEADFSRRDIERAIEKLRAEWFENYPMGLSLKFKREPSFFGPNKDILVFIPENHPFNYFRDFIDQDLGLLGVESASEFEYQAHVTAPKGWNLFDDPIPEGFSIGAPVLWWGKDRPHNSLTGKRLVTVKGEHVVETHHFSRHIKLSKGPLVSTKKNVMGNRTTFRARELVINWRKGEKPSLVIVYGKTRGFPKINARRGYKLAKAPQWIKDLM